MTTMSTALLDSPAEAVKHGSSTDSPILLGASDCSASRSNYKTILADPPWKWKPTGDQSARGRQPVKVPYPMMDTADICALPIGDLAAPGAHLWLWTDNGHLRDGFEVMEAWGFRYLAPVTWIKPSGAGMWFVHRTQTLLFGYRSPLVMRERYRANVFEATPGAHSAKPQASYELIEAVSEPARIEIFARPWTPLFPRRDGWDVWGNEVPQDVNLVTPNA
jgi:N6-adenosine-specific RNA methylase IME4